MAMTLRLTEKQTEASAGERPRRTAACSRSRSRPSTITSMRVEDDEVTDRLAQQGAQRYAELLRRLGE